MQEIKLQLPNLSLSAMVQGEGEPVLMLHGWMDNAASFWPLFPHLPGYRLIALEHAGHGHSEHRPAGHWYHLMDYVADGLAAADALGLERFHLVGHSLGGAVAALMSVAAPERISSLTLIDGLGPLAGSQHDIAQRMKRSWHQLRGIDPNRLRRYQSVNEALEARLLKSEIDRDAARALVQRGLRADGEYWVWRSDPRLNITTPYRFDEEQIQCLLAAIESDCLVVIPDPPSPILPFVEFERRLAGIKKAQLFQLPGGHHLHMNHPQKLAPHMLSLWQRNAISPYLDA